MSRLYVNAFTCFLVRSQSCNLFFRKVVGRTLLHVNKKNKFVIANRAQSGDFKHASCTVIFVHDKAKWGYSDSIFNSRDTSVLDDRLNAT